MSYAEAVDHLYARGLELAPDPSAPAGTRRKFDLEHMRLLARALGNPQQRFPSVLIAGTNGKGSTASTLASILTAAGYRTALYTSPHLVRVNERIQIDGRPISDDDFARLYFQVDSAAEHLVATGQLPHHPSFFETLTALAFLYFAGDAESSTTSHEPLQEPALPAQDSLPPNPAIPTQATPFNSVIPTEAKRSGGIRFSTTAAGQPTTPPVSFAGDAAQEFAPKAPPALREAVDIAILEVGLGGRLDATNIVDPLLSILTDISLDHQDYLGDTIAAITREKAGILRPHGTLITLPQHPEANQAIGEAAAELDIHAISAANYIPTADKLLTPRHPETLSPSGHPLESVILSEATNGSAVEGSAVPSHPHQASHPSPHQSSRPEPLPSTLSSRPEPPPSTLSSRPEARRAGVEGSASLPPQPTPPHTTFRNQYTITLANQPLHVDSPLFGQHQQRNLSLAIAAAEELRNPTGYKSKESNHAGYKITNLQIEEGIRNTRWPGRLELIPLPGSAPILLDVAHNPAGAWTLRAALSQLPESQPRTLLFSCLRDKDLREMSQILLPLFDSSSFDRPGDHIFFGPINSPRATPLEELAAAARDLEIPAESSPTLAEALRRAREVTPLDGIIVATGSVYLIGELRTLIQNLQTEEATRA